MKCVICGDNLITGLNGDICLNCLHNEQREIEQKEEASMYNLKHDLANSLQMLKKFDVGTTSRTNRAIAVEHDGQVFILRFELTPYTLDGVINDL